jgi:hypothetical protein
MFHFHGISLQYILFAFLSNVVLILLARLLISTTAGHIEPYQFPTFPKIVVSEQALN